MTDDAGFPLNPYERRQAEEIRQLRDETERAADALREVEADCRLAWSRVARLTEELARVKGMELAPPPNLGELPMTFTALMVGVMLPDFTRWVALRNMVLRPAGDQQDPDGPVYLVVPDPARVDPPDDHRG